jgi:hypothetical protein
MTPRDSSKAINHDGAETIAVSALSFLVSRPEDLDRFMALTGLGYDTIRESARDQGFLGGVLDHLLGDETLLTAFAADAGLPPEAIGQARRQLDPME